MAARVPGPDYSLDGLEVLTVRRIHYNNFKLKRGTK